MYVCMYVCNHAEPDSTAVRDGSGVCLSEKNYRLIDNKRINRHKSHMHACSSIYKIILFNDFLTNRKLTKHVFIYSSILWDHNIHGRHINN